MKFVTLALATLLALGCQAASLQADDPGYLQQARDALTWTIKQVQSSGHNIAERITDPELKQMVIHRVDTLASQVGTLRENTEPLTNSAVTTITEATADLRAKLDADMATLKAELEPMRKELREVIEKHIEEYRSKLTPVIADYQAEQQKQMAEFKTRFQPVFEDLQTRVSENVEETKAKLMPIVSALSSRIGEQVEYLKTLANPYVDEYREQARNAYQQAQSIDHAAIMEKAQPHIQSLRTCLDDFAAKMKTVIE